MDAFRGTRTAVLFGVLLTLLLAASPVKASVDGAGTISTADDVLTWDGMFDQPSVACLAEAVPEVFLFGGETIPLGLCSEYHITLDLPPDVWGSPGGLQVSVHWPYDRLDHEVDIAIYGPGGALVGFTASTDTDAESLLIANALNGTYRVLVAAVVATEPFDYTVRAEVEYLPAVEPLRALLPNLRALPPTHVMLAPTAAYPPGPFVGGCSPQERLEDGAARCLRFQQAIVNDGSGPMELRYSGEDLGAEQAMYQRVFSSDGSFTDTEVSSYEVHLWHGHVHYTSFAVSRLWASDETGAKIGADPVREGRKNGFCLIDVQLLVQDVKGDAPRTYDGSGCADLVALVAGSEGVHGISVGWADTYNWYLDGQFIEVSGVPDGFYLLETEADPDDTVTELADGDNASSVLIRLCGDSAEIVGVDPSECSGAGS